MRRPQAVKHSVAGRTSAAKNGGRAIGARNLTALAKSSLPSRRAVVVAVDGADEMVGGQADLHREVLDRRCRLHHALGDHLVDHDGIPVGAGHLPAGDVLFELDPRAVGIGTEPCLVEHYVGDVAVRAHHAVHDPVRRGFVHEPASITIDEDDPARKVRLGRLHEVRVQESEPAVLADDLGVDRATEGEGIPTGTVGTDVPHPVARRRRPPDTACPASPGWPRNRPSPRSPRRPALRRHRRRRRRRFRPPRATGRPADRVRCRSRFATAAVQGVDDALATLDRPGAARGTRSSPPKMSCGWNSTPRSTSQSSAAPLSLANRRTTPASRRHWLSAM